MTFAFSRKGQEVWHYFCMTRERYFWSGMTIAMTTTSPYRPWHCTAPEVSLRPLGDQLQGARALEIRLRPA